MLYSVLNTEYNTSIRHSVDEKPDKDIDNIYIKVDTKSVDNDRDKD